MAVMTNVKGNTLAVSQDHPIIDILNSFIEINLPDINREIPGNIKCENLDPMPDKQFTDILKPKSCECVANFTVKKVDLNATYTVSNCCGLSSLIISSFEINSVEKKDASDTGRLPYAVVGVQIEVKLSKDITADIKDLRIYSACPNSLDFFKSTGTIKASNVTATTQILFKICINKDAQICIKPSDITNLQVDYGHLDVEIEGLDNLPPFLKKIKDEITKHFKENIKSRIEDNTKLEVKDRIDKRPPLCVGLPKPKA